MSKLYVSQGCAASLGAIVALDKVGVTYELVLIDKKVQFSKEFREINPLGHSVVLKTESSSAAGLLAVLRFAGRKQSELYGSDALAKAQVDQWLEILESDVLSQSEGTLNQITGSAIGKDRLDYKDVTKNIEELVKSLAFLNNYLNGKKFLVGESLTIADIGVVSVVQSFFRFVLNNKQRKQLTHLQNYLTEKVGSEEFKGHVRPLDTEAEFKHVQVDLAEEKKQADAEKKRLAEEKKQKEEEERRLREMDKPKKITFPEPKICMDDWKKYVVNEKDDATKFKWIKENFEPEAYSFWKLDYDKLDNELKVLFLSKNQLNGFFNRSESFRNHVFCYQALLGEEDNYNIRGVWFWKGPEKLPNLDENTSTEFFKYRKLDINNEEDFNLIKEYLSLKEEDVENKKLEGETVRAFVNFK